MIICVHIYNVLKVKNAKSHLPPTKNTKYFAVSAVFAISYLNMLPSKVSL